MLKQSFPEQQKPNKKKQKAIPKKRGGFLIFRGAFDKEFGNGKKIEYNYSVFESELITE